MTIDACVERCVACAACFAVKVEITDRLSMEGEAYHTNRIEFYPQPMQTADSSPLLSTVASCDFPNRSRIRLLIVPNASGNLCPVAVVAVLIGLIASPHPLAC